MSESTDSECSPWRALWLHPGDAIEAVLARKSQGGTLALAAVFSALEVLLIVGGPLGLFAGGRDGRFWVIAVLVAIAGAIVGLLAFYGVGYLVNALARGLGGRGSASATRAALIWSSAPSLVSAALALGASLALGDQTTAPLTQVSLGLIELIGAGWSMVLVTAMLARVQRFRASRAFASWLIGDVVVAYAVAILVRTLIIQPFNTPSSSMAPTLLVGDYFFASKWDYGYSHYSLPYELPLFEDGFFHVSRGAAMSSSSAIRGAEWTM